VERDRRRILAPRRPEPFARILAFVTHPAPYHPGMLFKRRPWQEELEIIDRVMRDISGISDPEEMVGVYWSGISALMSVDNYLALSRRGVPPPSYLITRSSRFPEEFNPWKQRDRLPLLTGGLLGEIAYAERPVVIEDLPSALSPDDPAHFYLQGFASLVAVPQYDNGVGLNVGISLFDTRELLDLTAVPMMHWQAGLFGRGTQNLVLRNQLAEALAELDRELNVVGEIQRSLLPRELPSPPGFRFAAHYETSARAGGDSYDFFDLGEHELGIFIADVSGHGTPAAVLMAVTHAIAHTRPGFPKPPGELLAHINDHLCRSYTAAGTFVTAFYATLDLATRRLTYATAGHNPPRLRRADRVISLDGRGGLPLGVLPDQSYADVEIALQPGDTLLLYTDGITESFAPANSAGAREMFGVARLDRLLTACAPASPEVCIQSIRDAVAEFTAGAPATDDRTLVAIQCG
jgi:sigma-B regulation protein RsbU (phosphoserine phosphatase)